MSHNKIAEIVDEIRDWVSDPFNESFMFQRSVGVLNEFLSGDELNIGKVLVSLDSLSTWYASIGILETLSGKECDHLCDSFWCDYLEYRLTTRRVKKEEHRTKRRPLASLFGVRRSTHTKPQLSFNGQGLLIAKAFVLGLVGEGEAIARESLVGLKERWFYGVNQTKVTPFILSVFAKWKRIDHSVDDLTFAIPNGYRGLLDHLENSAQEIGEAIKEACEFHLSRSKNHTEDETFEFANPVEAIYPVEILMVLRIRQILGLSNPQVEHPLLDSALGRLPEAKCFISPSLKLILEKINRGF